VIPKQTNVHKCMVIYYTHCIAPTCSGYTCDHPQRGTLQGIDTRVLISP